jgi:hypothetical protein
MATDNSTFFPNRKALSQEFSYTPKPSSVNGRTFRVSVPSSNATSFVAGQTMVFNIPCGRRNCVLDPTSSYIRYTIKMAATTVGTQTASAVSSTVNGLYNTQLFGTGAFCDHNAYSVFNTTTLYSGSNMIEYINGSNVLYSHILDTNFSYSNALSNSLHYGMYVPDVSPLEIRKGNLFLTSPLSSATPTAFSQSATGTASTSIAEQNTFCLPLLSGLLGIGSSGKMVPIYAINDVLRLEILLENQTQAFVQLGNGSATYTIINAELELQYIELSDEGMSLVNSSTPAGSPIFIVGNSFRHYVQTIKNGTTGIYSCLVPSKLASLKALHILPRRNTEINSATSYSLSSRVNPYFDYVVLKVSGTQVPQKPILLQGTSTTGGFGEGLVELQKCFGSLIATDKSGLLNTSNYNVAVTANTTTGVLAVSTDLNSYKNAFALGIDFELFGSKDTVINGLNCLAESLYFEANISTDPGADFTLDFFASFDNLFIVDQTGYVSSRA